MDARIQSALLAGIVSLALALAMLLRRNRTRLWTAFAFLNLSLFLYQLGDFLLGVLAYKAPGWTTDYEVVDMLPAAKATLKPGKNVLAVHCHQVKGGQYIDVGIVDVVDGEK